MFGLLAVALTVPGSVPDAHVWWYLAVPLLLAGLGGGSVITPNQALSLVHTAAALSLAVFDARRSSRRVEPG